MVACLSELGHLVIILIVIFLVLFIVLLPVFIPFFIVAVVFVLLLDNRSRCRFAPSHRLPSAATTLFDWLGLISLLLLVQIDRVQE